MTDPRAWLDAVDARTNAATDGPWMTAPSKYVPGTYVHQDRPNGAPIIHATAIKQPDAEFIASARTDLPAATTALRAVLDLADMWDSRADHDLEALKTFPVEVQDALYGQAWDMKHKATYIRTAITTALEDA